MTRIILFLIITIPLFAKAQIGNICIDSNRINPYYQCNDPNFDPTCGCNNVTYRNGCEMTNMAGVNYPSQYENGVCRSEIFYYSISPNPVLTKLDFHMQFAEQQETTATLQIFNVFGNLVFSRLFNNLTSYPQPPTSIFFTDLETGVYTLVVQAGGVAKRTKFIKHTL